MPDLSGQISFTARFYFTGVAPYLSLHASTTIPDIDKPLLTGHFVVTQPDGLEWTGAPASVAWDGTDFNTYTFPLTLCPDNTYERGTYTVTFVAFCPGYTYSQFTRTWEMEYQPVPTELTDGFDLFTPELKYSDLTNYQVGGWTIEDQSSLWNVTSAAGDITGTTNVLDFMIGGFYYDSTYHIVYTKEVGYLSTAYPWLIVVDKQTVKVTEKAFVPPTMDEMLDYLINIKNQADADPCNEALQKLFEEANSLYQYLQARVCAEETDGLGDAFYDYYLLTHNYQPFVYINSNNPIDPYDFAAGCGGGGGTGGGKGMIKVVVGVDGPAADQDTYTNALMIGLGTASNDRVEIEVSKFAMYNWGDYPEFTLDKTTGTITMLNGYLFQFGSALKIDLNQ